MPTVSEKLRLARRMARLGTESAFEVLVQARQLEAQGREIIHLEIGEPDFPTAGHVVQAAIGALRDGWTHYGPPAGLPQLREAIAEDAGYRRGIQVELRRSWSHLVPSPSCSSRFWPWSKSGDEVLYPDPGFPIYESLISFVGGRRYPTGCARSTHLTQI